MPDVFDIYTIIFLALAVFIFLRLRSVLSAVVVGDNREGVPGDQSIVNRQIAKGQDALARRLSRTGSTRGLKHQAIKQDIGIPQNTHDYRRCFSLMRVNQGSLGSAAFLAEPPHFFTKPVGFHADI